jgi:hypothetical protein
MESNYNPQARGGDVSCVLAGCAHSCEKMRPQAGVGRLKPAPPMQAYDLPLVAQAVPPANYIFSHAEPKEME